MSERTVKQLADGQRELRRLVVMGVGLMLVLTLYFVLGPTPAKPDDARPPVAAIRVATPELDAKLLATVDDAGPSGSGTLHEDALRHLLERSGDVVPEVARALGRAPLDLAAVRAEPARFRGHWLWTVGTLEHVEPLPLEHPVAGRRAHAARVKLADGSHAFLVFTHPSEELRPPARVTIEGFFLQLCRSLDGLRDTEAAPVLVGPELQAAVDAWPPVERLDPAVLLRIADGRLGPDRTLVEREGIALRLHESESEPLWHVASHTRARAARVGNAEPEAPEFQTEAQWRGLEFGETARGTPFRVTGVVAAVTTIPARANPAGIEHWSEVWVQNRALRGRLFPVWIPRAVGNELRSGDGVLAHALYFRRLLYPSADGREHQAPVFVAADVQRVAPAAERDSGGTTRALVLGFAALVVLLLFARRRAERSRARFETERIARLRLHRAVRGAS